MLQCSYIYVNQWQQNPRTNTQEEKSSQRDVLLPFLAWTDSDDLRLAVRAMEPELEAGPRRKTPERRLVWRRMRLLLGCLTTTPSADLLVDELPVDVPDLMTDLDQDLSCWSVHEQDAKIPNSMSAPSLLSLTSLWKGRVRGRESFWWGWRKYGGEINGSKRREDENTEWFKRRKNRRMKNKNDTVDEQ